MNEKKRDLLVRVLDMNETEMRACLIAVVDGTEIEIAIDVAYNELRRKGLPIKDWDR